MNSRVIQVTGTGVANKGAELMAIATQRQFAAMCPEVTIAVPSDFGDFEARARYSLRVVLPELPRRRSWIAARIMPSRIRQAIGVVLEHEVEAVLDASGFAFGDQLGLRRVKAFERDVGRWKKAGKKVILLPQSLGPFTNPSIRDSFQNVCRMADLIFARETDSLSYTQGLRFDHAKLRLAPDFTNLLAGTTMPEGVKSFDALIVPNHQIIAKRAAAEAGEYYRFLSDCLKACSSLGLSAAVMLHDANVDSQLIEPLKEIHEQPFDVIRHSDPLVLKAVIRSSRLVIGSRFHALVGALSQAVPVLATGWSHKYEMLLSDYNCSQNILALNSTQDALRADISAVIANELEHRKALCFHGEAMRRRTHDMWAQVAEVLASPF